MTLKIYINYVSVVKNKNKNKILTNLEKRHGLAWVNKLLRVIRILI